MSDSGVFPPPPPFENTVHAIHEEEGNFVCTQQQDTRASFPSFLGAQPSSSSYSRRHIFNLSSSDSHHIFSLLQLLSSLSCPPPPFGRIRANSRVFFTFFTLPHPPSPPLLKTRKERNRASFSSIVVAPDCHTETMKGGGGGGPPKGKRKEGGGEEKKRKQKGANRKSRKTLRRIEWSEREGENLTLASTRYVISHRPPPPLPPPWRLCVAWIVAINNVGKKKERRNASYSSPLICEISVRVCAGGRGGTDDFTPLFPGIFSFFLPSFPPFPHPFLGKRGKRRERKRQK